jgi:hypothetical protein
MTEPKCCATKENGALLNCENQCVVICRCNRCNSEDDIDEVYFSCEEHLKNVIEAHTKVRGYSPNFYSLVEGKIYIGHNVKGFTFNLF